MSKTLLIILHGEARGLGTSYDSAGPNVLDVILANTHILEAFSNRIHVLWSISNTKLSYENRWDISYSIDKNGNKIPSTDYLTSDEVEHNISNFMSEYSQQCTYEIMWREPIEQRWGKGYATALNYSVANNFDFTIMSRPDMNISAEQESELFIQTLKVEDNSPKVILNQGPTNTLLAYHAATDNHTLIRRNYEIMMWNKPALKILAELMTTKAKFDWGKPSDLPGESPYNPPWGLDGAETFWSLILVLMVAFVGSEHLIVQGLPFRNQLRESVTNDNNV